MDRLMSIYCDRLTIRSCLYAIKICFIRRYLSSGPISKLYVLDPIQEKGWQTFLSFFMKLLGFDVQEVKVMGNGLKMKDGTAVGAAAREKSWDIAFDAAGDILNRSRTLAILNESWGRNAILLYVAKFLWLSAYHAVLRILVVQALTRDIENQQSHLILSGQRTINKDVLINIVPEIHLIFYHSCIDALKMYIIELGKVFYLLLNMIRGYLKASVKLGYYNPDHPFSCCDNCLPSLLALQEDDLSMDRSFRTQPHWLFADNGPVPFRTIVINTGKHLFTEDKKFLKKYNVESLLPLDVYSVNGLRFQHPVKKRLSKDLFRFFVLSLFTLGTKNSIVMMALVRLFLYALSLADFCKWTNVKAFITCENYMIWSDAMQLIAEHMGIHTVSYQYSNLRCVGPLMLTNADIMITFSSLYHQRWTHPRIQPGSFIDVGYIFDSSFHLLRKRSKKHRAKLEAMGARFIICYFDETVLYDKYSVIKEQNYIDEFSTLINFMLDDPSVGIVVKSQFRRNTPLMVKKLMPLIRLARDTGRYLELYHGNHRNTVFAAEAALCADITIGNSLGSTASLEAVIAGIRSIMINPYGIKGDNDQLYEQADIVYESLDDALSAIQKYREGRPDFLNIGDWSPIIDQFDPYRDGNAGHRMRKILEEIVTQQTSSLESFRYI